MNLRHRSCGLARRAAFCLIAAGLLAVPAVQAAPVQLSAPLGDRDNDLFTEGFEGTWLPAGWAKIQTHPAQTWNRSNYDAHTGTYCAAVFWSSALQNEWLVTPALNLTGAINPKLEWYERGINWATSTSHHYIMASTTSQTDPAAFSIVADFVPGNHTIPTDFDGAPAVVNLSSLAGQPVVYLAFRYYDTGTTGDSWFIDDVRVFTPSGHDVGSVAVTPDGGNQGYGSPVTPQVTVENFGLASETFDVELVISQSGSSIYTQSLGVSNLAPGAQSVLNFPAFTPAAGQYYDLTATTQLAGDTDASNDGAAADFTTYFDNHVPLGMLFTNSGCGPCVQANQALDAYMPGQGNQVALLRVHTWWPYAGDIMYTANPAQAQALVAEFGVNAVPDFWLDTSWHTDYQGSVIVAAFNTGKTWKSPMHLGLQWNDDTDQLTTVVNITGALRPGGNYELFCSITEDGIVHNGGNGEPLHQQAFRRMWPGTSGGVAVPDAVGSHPLVVNMPLTGTWVYSNLRATVYVRDMNSGAVVQAATDFLTNIESLTGVETPTAAGFGVLANHPNPFNPKTSIDYAVKAAGPASLRIYDSAGRLVTTLVDGVHSAGSHRAVWDGTDGAGNALPSGVYLVRLQSAGQQDSHKLLLAK
jgi:hypothetical protein